MIQWLERKFHKFAIPHLTIALVILTAVVTGYDITTNESLGDLSFHTLLSEQPWKAFLFPFYIPVGSIFGRFTGLILFLYVFWMFGSMVGFPPVSGLFM